jgi:hypothetical protein
MRTNATARPYLWVLGLLWLLPDDDWEYGCGPFGCGWPSNIAYPMLLFWLWLWFLLPAGLLGLVVVFVRRRLRENASAGARKPGGNAAGYL